MKKFILTGLICLFSFPWIRGQEYIPQITHRHYTSDSTLLQPRRPWKAALETFGLNMLVWSFDRYIVKEDWCAVPVNSWAPSSREHRCCDLQISTPTSNCWMRPDRPLKHGLPRIRSLPCNMPVAGLPAPETFFKPDIEKAQPTQSDCKGKFR